MLYQDLEERKKVREKLEQTNHEIVDITRDQVEKFCGNVLELENWKGFPVLAMSTQAYNAFTPQQKEILVLFPFPSFFLSFLFFSFLFFPPLIENFINDNYY